MDAEDDGVSGRGARPDALKQLETPEAVAKRRGMAVEDVAPAALLRAAKEEVAK